MTKIDIYSGFLGAGKTTLIKKMIAEAYKGQKLVLIENEFGQIGIDSGFLQDSGINITEMNSGCICCSLVGDFGKALEQVLSEYTPDRIIIEPSGVGKLSDVIGAVEKVTNENVVLGNTVAVVDAGKVKIYMKNFGEFYNNQVENASTVILSRTDLIDGNKLENSVSMLKQLNDKATFITTPWHELTGIQIAEAIEGADSVTTLLEEMQHEHHHHDEEECCCGHHHGEHHHHHDDEECCCGHHHGDHHHHHADEVFTSWGTETIKKFTERELQAALNALDTGRYGIVLRAKGIVACANGGWLHFDYVPEEMNIRPGAAAVTGKLCVIGSNLNETAVKALFGV